VQTGEVENDRFIKLEVTSQSSPPFFNLHLTLNEQDPVEATDYTEELDTMLILVPQLLF
jgi:hypothetical protein